MLFLTADAVPDVVASDKVFRKQDINIGSKDLDRSVVVTGETELDVFNAPYKRITTWYSKRHQDCAYLKSNYIVKMNLKCLFLSLLM